MAKNTVIVSITSNISGLQKGVDGAESSLGSLAKTAGVVAAAVGAVAVAIGVKAVKSASELEQNMGALEAVFKGSAGQMTQWSRAASGSVGLAQSEYAGLATVIGSQLKNMGVSTDALAGQTDSLVRMGADLAAQFGGSTSDAVSALSSLLRGERDPIERYGVSINQAAIDAKLAEMGLAGLSGEAAKNAQLQATLALLTQQTADAQGAFARESTTLAGQQQRVGAMVENVYAALGQSLLPAVTATTAAFGSMVERFAESEVFADLRDNLTAGSEAFADFVFSVLNGERDLGEIDIAGFIVQAIPKMFAARDQLVLGLVGALPEIATSITTALPGIIQTISTALTTSLMLVIPAIAAAAPAILAAGIQLFMGLLQAVLSVLPQLIATVVGLVPTLVASIVTMIPILLAGAIQLFQSLIEAVVIILPSLITQLLDMLPSILESVLSMIPAILDAAVAVFTMLVESIPIILPKLVDAIIKTLPKLVQTIVSMLPKILQAAIDLFTALVNSLPIILPALLTAILNLLPSILSSVISMIPALINGAVQLFVGIVTAVPKIIPDMAAALIALAPQMVSTLIGLVPQLVQAGVDLIAGLVSGLWNAAAGVGEALLSIAQNAVGDFLSFLGIHSPSRLFREYGLNVGEGLALGIDKSGKVVTKSMDKLSDLTADSFSADLSGKQIRGDLRGYGELGKTSTVTKHYEIKIETLTATAETGRVIVEAIADYEDAGGRR